MSDNAATLEEVENQLGPRSAHALALVWLDALFKGTAKARRLAVPGFDVRGTQAQLRKAGLDRHSWDLLRGDEAPGETCVTFLAHDYRDAYRERGLDGVPLGGMLFVWLRRHGPPHARPWRVTALKTNVRHP